MFLGLSRHMSAHEKGAVVVAGFENKNNNNGLSQKEQ
jgi:hypothetical protein